MPEQGQAQQALTAEEVRQIVGEYFDTLGGQIDTFADSQAVADSELADRLDNVSSSVSLLAADLDSKTVSAQDLGVVEVRATGSQVDTAKSALQVLCTEGLVLIVVLSINAGLLGWQAFRGRFVSNG